MVEGRPVRLALLSVHPEYASALVSGRKTVEFRKRPLAPDVTHVVIYATQPVARVVGVFSIREQVMESPRQLWNMFHNVAGISKAKFMDYYRGCSTGVGIRVGEMTGLPDNFTLQEAFGISRPPQSFQYFTLRQTAPKLAGVLV
ncbi:ASCH domain-containing protein [Mycolicibacterium diernhoferi]|uniref:ASCH domain-containing protein n=1 Tax=Mycolicibacterium diernhoferi TaxID=1801 RepID=A0A2A7NSC4_9MYCO|nr:ASCH domain-containing protein [Mycolicibacterium diernhoferi]